MTEKKPPKTVVIPAPGWLISFGDTVALMLAFFVMLYAISSLDPSNVARLIAAVVTKDVDVVKRMPTPNSNFSIESVNLYRGWEIPYIIELLHTKFLSVPLLEKLEVLEDNNEIVVVLPDDVFVSDSDANISEHGKQLLYDLGLILATIGNSITVEGYSPPEVSSADDKVMLSNRWEIRLLRATNVAQQMKENGLLASNRILGWAHPPRDSGKVNPGKVNPGNESPIATESDDTRVALRIDQTAGGQ